MLAQFDYIQTYNLLKPLIIFIVAMSIYSIFVFKFYRFLARKDIIKLNLHSYQSGNNHWMIKSFFSIIFYVLEYIIILPLCIFFWFTILAILLTFLAKSQSIENILLVSIAVVGTVRLMAYYNEDLSKDLSKMLPFALLGVFLVDISYFNISSSLTMLKQISSNSFLLINYLGFIVVLELFLRIFYLIFGSAKDEEMVNSIINDE